MEENKLKLEIFKSLLENNLEEILANTLLKSSTFIEQILISVSSEETNKQELVKNLTNLKSYIENNIFDYKVKQKLILELENKKKEKENLKELENQKEQLEQDQLN